MEKTITKTVCDICERRQKDLSYIKVALWESSTLAASVTATDGAQWVKQKACDKCRARIEAFIAKAFHKPGWRPE